MKSIIAITSSLLLATGASAQTPPAPAPAKAAATDVVEVKATGTPGQAAATRTEKVSATVKSVDAAARTVTLQGKGNETRTVKVGPEVKRFSEIAAGDTIEVEFEQGLLLEFQPAGSEAVQPKAVAVSGRAPADQAPGGAVAAGVQATVTVTAIDLPNRMVVLQGPAGNLYQVKAGPKIKLEKLKVGDHLLATYVEALAITLEKKAAKK